MLEQSTKSREELLIDAGQSDVLLRALTTLNLKPLLQSLATGKGDQGEGGPRIPVLLPTGSGPAGATLIP